MIHQNDQSDIFVEEGIKLAHCLVNIARKLGLSRRRAQEELEESLGSNLEELERMTSIVNDMLFLSHAHAGEHASQLECVSLDWLRAHYTQAFRIDELAAHAQMSPSTLYHHTPHGSVPDSGTNSSGQRHG